MANPVQKKRMKDRVKGIATKVAHASAKVRDATKRAARSSASNPRVAKVATHMRNISHAVKHLSKSITSRRRKISDIPKHESGQEFPEQKVLMFGWELPPFNSGGLGVACYELASALAGKNAKITFVLPRNQDIKTAFMKIAFADDADEFLNEFNSKFSLHQISTPLSPYLTEDTYNARRSLYAKLFGIHLDQFASDLISEVYRYAAASAKIAKTEQYDVIHAHDWLSFPAAIVAKKISHKPFVAQIHALEQDRSPSPNPAIAAIEKEGLQKADKVIAISHYVKNRIMQFYHIPAHKIEVVHNGSSLAPQNHEEFDLKSLKKDGRKIVLSAGRITYQKGIDYLVTAAAKVMKHDKNFILVIVGSGDMRHQIIQQAASLGISDRVFFPGFLRSNEMEKIYHAADVFVMPSVSEPFGLVAVEAASRGVPLIISKQSGVAEVINHSLKVDFWDVDELANKLASVLRHKALRDTLVDSSLPEVAACTWDRAAVKCMTIYQNLSPA